MGSHNAKNQNRACCAIMLLSEDIVFALGNSMMRRPMIGAMVIVASIHLMAIDVPEVLATDPSANCDKREKLVAQLSDRPHFEREALVLLDGVPGQGHRIELFLNSGEGGRHSYTMLRTLRGAHQTCIVSAGAIGSSSTDKRARSHLILKDENDNEVFDIITCEGRYVITREFVDEDVCALMEQLFHETKFVVSYGRVLKDNRASIPWPSN